MAVDFLQGINWGTAGNWQSGSVPISNDEVAIPETLGSAVTGTPDQGGVDLDLLRIHTGFDKPIFTSGSPLKIAADLLEHFGSGNLFYTCDANSVGLKTDEVLIQCANSRVITELNSVSGDAGDYTTMTFNRGTVRILGDLTWDANGLIQVGCVENLASDVNLNIAAGSDVLAQLRQGGGTCVSSRAITVAYVAGTLKQDVAAITTLHILPGGITTYNWTTATTVIVYPGATLNLLGNTVEKTITDLWAMPKSTVLYDKSLFTGTNKRAGYDFHDYRLERA
ncbi:hypothetical protein LCGC14_1112320 [marine sediment metagenome]|uniref:G8 domain-containing protein n=1 Tax=marine sediment metagenome TaxID=412755 RepID=A0A0F9QCF9_9ZZZZ